MSAQRILIAGGGFTGLTAAYRLATQPGCEVHLWEKSPDFGGLAGGFQLQGHPIEKCYHALFLSDQIVVQLAVELGLGDRVQWHPASNGIYLGGKVWPFNSPLDLLRFQPMPFLDRVRTGLTALYLKYRNHPEPFEQHRALDWMRRACGEGAVRTLWEPLLRGKFSTHAETVSMAWLWARLNIRARSRSGQGERFGYIHGGFSTLVDALVARGEAAGARFQTNRAIAGLQPGATGGLRVTDTANRIEEFDRVLFTGSSRVFSRLLGDLPGSPALTDYRARLEAVPYLNAACLVFASKQELPAPFWLNVNEARAPFLVFVHHTRLVPKSEYGGLNVYYIGTYQPADSALLRQSDDNLVRQWYDYVRGIFPQFDRTAIVEERLFRFADAQHVVTAGFGARRPDHRTPVPGLYLANFAQIYPEDRGTNFAVRDGDAAARLIAADLATRSGG